MTKNEKVWNRNRIQTLLSSNEKERDKIRREEIEILREENKRIREELVRWKTNCSKLGKEMGGRVNEMKEQLMKLRGECTGKIGTITNEFKTEINMLKINYESVFKIK